MEKLYKLLSDTQASLFVLFQKTWVYHWHIVGPDFKQIHDLFGEQYLALQEEVDRIAEHMRFLEIKPVSSLSRVVEVSGIGEAKSNISEMEMIRDLMDGHQNFNIIQIQLILKKHGRFIHKVIQVGLACLMLIKFRFL